ncbi:MAG: alpha/beta hydrolase [Chloroflexi bacterium]|nr:alpha/beta hydrolase [Chloroflexota bacterium]
MPLHPQIVATMNKLAALNLPPATELTPEQVRKNSALSRAAVERERESVGKIEERSIPSPAGNIPVRIYRPESAGTHPLIMLFHGGGWVVGDLDTEDATCRGLCRRVGAVVISVDYRLAPETAYPGAVDDCFAATVWAIDHAGELGIDASRVATSGTSAGGNLSGAVAMMARDRGGPAIAHQLLFCPVIDADFDRSSYIRNATDYGLTRDGMIWFWDHYTGSGEDRYEPYASLIRAEDLSGLPDTTIIAAEFDPLVDEAVAYGDALKAAGVKTRCTVYDGMTHGFNGYVGVVDAAKVALDEAAAGIRASFGIA